MIECRMNFPKNIIPWKRRRFFENEGCLILSPIGNMVPSSEELMTNVFPNFNEHYKNPTWVSVSVILYINPGEYRSGAVSYEVECLNSWDLFTLSPHEWYHNVCAPIILLRNLHPPRPCYRTRLVVRKMMRHVINAAIH